MCVVYLHNRRVSKISCQMLGASLVEVDGAAENNFIKQQAASLHGTRTCPRISYNILIYNVPYSELLNV